MPRVALFLGASIKVIKIYLINTDPHFHFVIWRSFMVSYIKRLELPTNRYRINYINRYLVFVILVSAPMVGSPPSTNIQIDPTLCPVVGSDRTGTDAGLEV